MSAAIMQLVALNQGSGIQQGALVHHPQTSQQSAPKSKSEAARRKKQASINAKQAKVDKLARQASLDAQEQQPPGSLQFSARGSLPITTGSHHRQPGGSRLPLQPLSNPTQLPSNASAAGKLLNPWQHLRTAGQANSPNCQVSSQLAGCLSMFSLKGSSWCCTLDSLRAFKTERHETGHRMTPRAALACL